MMNADKAEFKKTSSEPEQYLPLPEEKSLVGTKRVAEILGCSPSTVIKVYIREGMPHFIKGARNTKRPHYQFNPQACLDWYFANKQA